MGNSCKYIFTYTYVSIRIHMCTHMYTHVTRSYVVCSLRNMCDSYLHVHVSICIQMYTYVYIHVYDRDMLIRCVLAWKYVRFMFTCTYVHMYTYVYIHVYERDMLIRCVLA